MMWFASVQGTVFHPWLLHLAGKMLDNDPIVDKLLAKNPFKGYKKPNYVRARIYGYEWAEPDGREARAGKWWKRRNSDKFLQPVNKDYMKSVYIQAGWKN